MANQAFAFKTSYTAKLNPQAIDSYNEFFTSIGIPSGSKMGVVFDIVHAYPFMNGNSHGFTSDVIRNSAMSFLNSLIDINHDRQWIVGSIVKVDLIEEADSPLLIRLVGVLDKEILKDWGIEDLINEDWSMECRYSEYVFTIANKIYRPEEVPEVDQQFSDLADGKAVYDQRGNRVGLLLGGVSGVVDFNRCGLIIWGEGADSFAETHLQVANKKQNTKGSETMPFKQFETEEQYNEAMNQAVAAKQKDMDKMQKMMDDMKQNMEDMQKTMDTMKNDMDEAKASLVTEKERADAAESKLQAQATATLISERKQVLASKNYPEDRIVKKEEWLGKASKEEFDSFIEEVDALFASATKSFQSKAEQLGMKEAVGSLFNITGQGQDNKDEKGDVVIF